jgi:hypothetical protein
VFPFNKLHYLESFPSPQVNPYDEKFQEIKALTLIDHIPCSSSFIIYIVMFFPCLKFIFISCGPYVKRQCGSAKALNISAFLFQEVRVLKKKGFMVELLSF